MPVVHGLLKSNKLVLQGHGNTSQDVVMKVQDDQFLMKMNDDVLIAIGKDDDSSSLTTPVDPVINIEKNTNFSENVSVGGNLTVDGVINNPKLDQFKASVNDKVNSLNTKVDTNSTNIQNIGTELQNLKVLGEGITGDSNSITMIKPVTFDSDVNVKSGHTLMLGDLKIETHGSVITVN